MSDEQTNVPVNEEAMNDENGSFSTPTFTACSAEVASATKAGKASVGKKAPKDNEIEENKLREELEIAKKKVDEYLNGWKRAKADYINQKKEFEKREKDMIQFANAALILEIMPIYDNFKLAWQHIPAEHQKNDEWLKGIAHIKNQFRDLLKNLGIEEIKTVGEKFDPELHEAVAREKAAGKESGTIIAEVKGGYKLQDKVLEHAKVKVAA